MDKWFLGVFVYVHGRRGTSKTYNVWTGL